MVLCALDNQKYKVLKPIPSPSYSLHPNSLSWYSHLPNANLTNAKRRLLYFLLPSCDFMLGALKDVQLFRLVQSKLGNNKAKCLSMADLIENQILAKSKVSTLAAG